MIQGKVNYKTIYYAYVVLKILMVIWITLLFYFVLLEHAFPKKSPQEFWCSLCYAFLKSQE